MLMKTDQLSAQESMKKYPQLFTEQRSGETMFILFVIRGVRMQRLETCCSAEPRVALTKSTVACGSAEQQVSCHVLW